MPEHANVLIAGGGIIGSSLAWALASRGVDDVVVVDLDLNGIYASSELNAGGARATWWQPVNIESCKATLEFFREHAEHFGFRSVGYLWLYDDEALHRRALEKRQLQNQFGLEVEALSPGELGERFPATLSGGQRQRVGVARALAARPRIVLMDEPFGAVDPITRDALSCDYRRLHDELGLTTVMITHDVLEAVLLADRIAVFNEGQIVETGSPHDLLSGARHPYVRDLMAMPQRQADRIHALTEAGPGLWAK